MPEGRQRVHLLVPSRVQTAALQEALSAKGFEPVVTSGTVRSHRRRMPSIASHVIAIGNEAYDGFMLVSRSGNPERRLALVAPVLPEGAYESTPIRASAVDRWKAQIRNGMQVIFVAGGTAQRGSDLFEPLFRELVTRDSDTVREINAQLRRQDTIRTIVDFMAKERN